MRRNAHNTRSLRNLNLVVRISPGELKALRRAAHAAGATVSVFVREVLLHEVAAQSERIVNLAGAAAQRSATAAVAAIGGAR